MRGRRPASQTETWQRRRQQEQNGDMVEHEVHEGRYRGQEQVLRRGRQRTATER